MHDQLPGHLLSVYRFAMHLCGDQHLAEDLTQEAMLRGLRTLTTLNNPDAMRIWLFRIVKNLWNDKHRARKFHSASSLNEEDIAGVELDPSENAEIGEQIARTLEAMKKLPERQRTVLHLIACQQFSIVEAAGVLEISSAAVRSSLSLARAQMRKTIYSHDVPSYKTSIED